MRSRRCESDEYASRYGVVADVHYDDVEELLECDEGNHDEEEEQIQQRHTLADTLYRYLVLFGVPSSEQRASVAAWHENPVWEAIAQHLEQKVATRGTRRGKARKGRGEATSVAFQLHREEWALEQGAFDLGGSSCQIAPRLFFFFCLLPFLPSAFNPIAFLRQLLRNV